MAVSSHIIEYYKDSQTSGIRDGDVTMSETLYFNKGKYALKVCQIALSPEIPNVYSYDGVDTTKFWISNNNWTTHHQVTLPQGNYTIQEINLAIKNILITIDWYNPNSPNVIDRPPIVLGFDTTSGKIYLELHSAVSSTGKIAINFGISNFGHMLGFVNPNTFATSGLYLADSFPLIDYQGSTIAIKSSFQKTKMVNGQYSNELCRIPIPSNDGTEIIYPTGGIIPPILATAQIPTLLSSFSIKFINPRTGKSIFWSYGAVDVQLEIIRIG